VGGVLHAGDSQLAVRLLADRKPRDSNQVWNLQGGIDAWSVGGGSARLAATETRHQPALPEPCSLQQGESNTIPHGLTQNPKDCSQKAKARSRFIQGKVPIKGHVISPKFLSAAQCEEGTLKINIAQKLCHTRLGII